MRNRTLSVAAGTICALLLAGAQSWGQQSEPSHGSQEAASLVQRVRDAQTVDGKVAILKAVETYEKREFADPLSEILLDDTQHWRVRWLAVSKLESTGSPKAIPALAKVILDYDPGDNSDGWERRRRLVDWAITCLGWSGETAAPVLQQFLEDDVIPGWHFRFITALGETGSPEALETVQRYLEQDGASVAHGALALGCIVRNLEDEATRLTIREKLMRLAQHEDHSVRSKVAGALSAFPHDPDVVSLLERMAREDPYTSLASRGDWEGEGYPVRITARRALEEIGMQLEAEAAAEQRRARDLALAAEADEFVRQFTDPTSTAQIKEQALWSMGRWTRAICRKDSLTSDDLAALDHLREVFEPLKASEDEAERKTALDALNRIEDRLGG